MQMRGPSARLVFYALVAIRSAASAQPRTVAELEHLFTATPAEAFIEASSMLGKAKASGDLKLMTEIACLTAKRGSWFFYYPMAENLLDDALIKARERSDWSSIGALSHMKAELMWGQKAYGLPTSVIVRRAQGLAREAEAAYAKAGEENDDFEVFRRELAEYVASKPYRQLEAETKDYAQRDMSADLAALLSETDTALMQCRYDDALDAMRRTLLLIRDNPRVADGAHDAAMHICDRLWIRGSTQLLPLCEAIVRTPDWPDANRTALIGRLARGCIWSWSGYDDEFSDCIWRSAEGHWENQQMLKSIRQFLEQMVRIDEEMASAPIIFRWAEKALATDGSYTYATSLARKRTPFSLRMTLLSLSLRSAVELGLFSEQRFQWNNVINSSPDTESDRIRVATAEQLILWALRCSDARSQAYGVSEASRLFKEAGEEALAVEAQALAEAIASGDPEVMRAASLTRACSAASDGRWQEVVGTLEAVFTGAEASSDLIEASILLSKAHLNLDDKAAAGEWYRRASDAIDGAGLSVGERVGYLKSLAALAEDEEWKVRMLERARAAADASGLETLQESVSRQLAEVALASGRLSSAESALIDLIDRSEQKRHRLVLDPRLRQEWFADHIGPYRQLMRVAVLQADAQLALGCGERMRSRALMDQLAWKQVDLSVEIPDDLRQRLSDLRAMRRRAYGLLTQVMGGGEMQRAEADAGDDERGKYMPIRGAYMPIRGLYMPIRGPLSQGNAATDEDVARLAWMLDELAAEEKALEGAIREQVPAYARAAQTTIPSGEALAAEVAKQPGLAVLHYTFADEGLVVTGVSGSTLRARLIEEDRDALYEQIGRFREAIWERSDDAYAQARALYQTLVRPVEDVLSGADRLWIVADGIVQLVPFAALIDGHNDYLGQRMPIAFAPSLTLALSSRGEREAPSHDAVVVAAPETGATQMAMADTEGDDGRGLYMPIRGMYLPVRGAYMPIRGEGEMSSALTAMAMVALPEARAEGEAVAGLYENATLLTGAEATKAALGEVGGDCGMLHIATHGYADPDFPDFSGLLLSSTEGRDSAYQVLTAGEVYGWPLKARLVTLSACQTALGRDVEGEGILGLSRAFIYAGAQHVVCSLWPVSDASTRTLMTAFYEALENGASVEEALQAGQNALPADGDTAHPFYWAGFITVRGPG